MSHQVRIKSNPNRRQDRSPFRVRGAISTWRGLAAFLGLPGSAAGRTHPQPLRATDLGLLRAAQRKMGNSHQEHIRPAGGRQRTDPGGRAGWTWVFWESHSLQGERPEVYMTQLRCHRLQSEGDRWGHPNSAQSLNTLRQVSGPPFSAEAQSHVKADSRAEAT